MKRAAEVFPARPGYFFGLSLFSRRALPITTTDTIGIRSALRIIPTPSEFGWHVERLDEGQVFPARGNQADNDPLLKGGFMKIRTALSLTALLAGTSLGWSQEAAPATSSTMQMTPVSSAAPAKPATFMDYMRAKQTSQTVEVAAPVMATGGAVVHSDPIVPMTTTPAAGPSYQFYGSAEYLLWRLGSNLDTSGADNLPQIRPQVPYIFLSRSVIVPAPDEPQGLITNELVNVYGLVSVRPVLFAGSNLDSNDRNGMRLNLGMNLGSDYGVEVTWFQLERRTASFLAVAASNIEIENGLTNLIRQPADAMGVRPPPLVEDTEFSPLFTHQIFGQGTSRMWGLELNGRGYGYQIGTSRVEGILGLRYVNFQESLDLTQVTGVQDATYVGVLDFFGDFVPGVENLTILQSNMSARNRFYGAQAGVFGETEFFGFFVNGTAKVAVGGMYQEMNFNENVTALGATVPMPTNIYPYPTNFEETRTRLAWLPELTVNLGYNFTDNCRAWVGYNWLWMNRVIRPNGTGLPAEGDGTVTNLGQRSAAIGPALSNFRETRIIAHGLNFGFELRY